MEVALTTHLKCKSVIGFFTSGDCEVYEKALFEDWADVFAHFDGVLEHIFLALYGDWSGVGSVRERKKKKDREQSQSEKDHRGHRLCCCDRRRVWLVERAGGLIY